VLSKEDLNNVHDDPGFSPWQTLCPPNSTAQRLASGKPVEVAPQAPSFVSAHHEDAMDQCLHPEIQQQQGFTAWYVQSLGPISESEKVLCTDD
jgi:hypothetical protein